MKTATQRPRGEEDLCCAHFDSWLRRHVPGSALEWTYVPEQQQPPDFRLSVGGREYAVEVTMLWYEELVGNEVMNDLAISNPIVEFVRDVERRALEANVLSGSYIVAVPRPVLGFAKLRSRLAAAILAYIQDTRPLESNPSQVVMGGICRVEKVHGEDRRVYTIGPGYVGSEGELSEGLCQTLARTLETKRDKLAQLNLPIVLLIYDQHWASEAHMWHTCIQNLPASRAFHTIYVVQGLKKGFLLYCSQQSWTGLSDIGSE